MRYAGDGRRSTQVDYTCDGRRAVCDRVPEKSPLIYGDTPILRWLGS